MDKVLVVYKLFHMPDIDSNPDRLDTDRHAPDGDLDPDPDPAKRYGSYPTRIRIRIRIHNNATTAVRFMGRRHEHGLKKY